NPARQPRPRGLFMRKALLAGFRQAVKPRPTIVFRRAPIGGDPTLFLETLQSGVERSLLDLKDFFRELPDPLRDRPAVQRLERDGLQDQQVDGALNEIGGLPHDYL